jgi:pimeloyl-ACP methyl ester carboxylesterase
MYSHLLWDAVIPEYILVGLAYGGEDPDVGALRKLDLAPPPHSAGSSLPSADAHGNDYLSRLKHAIIPFVESEYGADPSFRVLAGCSIGGLFAMGAMFREPQLFNAIIALSATVATENRWLFKLEQQFRAGGGGLFSALIRRRRELPVRLFMAAGGDDDPSIIAALGDFDAQLGRSNYRFFEKSFRIVDGEKHAALKPEGFNRGIRFAFKSLVTL